MPIDSKPLFRPDALRPRLSTFTLPPALGAGLPPALGAGLPTAPPTLAAEVKKARGRSKPLTVAELRRLKEEHTTTITPLQTLATEAQTLESRISDLVNAAYGLTPDEIKLMWDTAPPRMPPALPPRTQSMPRLRQDSRE